MSSQVAGPLARLINMAAGAWLLFAPDVLGYEGIARVNHLVAGPLAFSVAAIALVQATREVRWANLLVGAWLVLSPLVVDHPPAALANGVVAGLVLALLALVEGARPDRMGGGWRAVIDPAAPGAPPPEDGDTGRPPPAGAHRS